MQQVPALAERLAPRCAFQMYAGSVRDLQFSPDGTLLASAGGADWTITLWHVADGSLARIISGHHGNTECMAFSPDGRLLASAGDSRVVCLWEAASGKLLATFAGTTHSVKGLHFTSDSRSLLAVDTGNSLMSWSLPDGHTRIEANGAPWSFVRDIAWRPDGQQVATIAVVERGVQVRGRGAERQGEAYTLRHPGSPARSVVFHPHDPLLTVAVDDGWLLHWTLTRAPDKNQRPTLAAGAPRVTRMVWHPSGEILAAGTLDGTCLLHQVGVGASTLHGAHLRAVTALRFSPDGAHLATAAADGVVRLWDETMFWPAALPAGTSWRAVGR